MASADAVLIDPSIGTQDEMPPEFIDSVFGSLDGHRAAGRRRFGRGSGG